MDSARVVIAAPLKTYVFRFVVEPDEDRRSAQCLALERLGVATGGYAQPEALRQIREVVEAVLEELVEENQPIPE